MVNTVNVINSNINTNIYSLQQSRSHRKQNVLFITAHPDDEAYFFGPSICHMVTSGFCIHLLCLSSGNYYGQGDIRKKELVKSMATYGVPSKNVTIYENSEIQDSLYETWDLDILEEAILDVIERISADVVVTFDSGGISQHPNHCSLYHALRQLHDNNKLPPGIRVFTLDTVNRLRRYLGLLMMDIPLSYLTSNYVILASPSQVIQIVKAVWSHWSQLTWFRVLNLLTSRYIYINTLTPLT